MVTAAYQTEMARLQDSKPVIKVEFIDPSAVVTDISTYYLSGANFDFKKNLVPDQIQAGSFDVVLSNHDDRFSEFKAASLIYGMNYHAAKIRISLGFTLSDGTTEYATQAIGRIDQLTADPGGKSEVTFRCRDFIQRIIDTTLHQRPANESPIYNASNTGNGTCSLPATRPFATVTENFTLTCTVAGGDSTAQFSVSGSVSGSVGTATSGTKFTASGNQCTFTLKVGTTNWSVGDIITFSTNKYPEYNNVNPAKIIWSILTGYNWDSNTQETFSAFTLNYDRTQSAANTDLDYQSFVDAIAALNQVVGTIKGFCPYQTNAATLLNSLLLTFMGSLFTTGAGLIKLKAYAPPFGGASASATFTDALKIAQIGYLRTVDEVINSVICSYRITDTWPFSDATDTLDGSYLIENSASITLYGRLQYQLASAWYQVNGEFLRSVAQRMLTRYNQPPTTMEVLTGLDAVLTEITNYISITDTKYGISAYVCEVIEVQKQLDAEPKMVMLRARQESDFGLLWGFLASEVNEGDGISPQSTSWDTATTSDKKFIYLSQTGGGGPDYRMF